MLLIALVSLARAESAVPDAAVQHLGGDEPAAGALVVSTTDVLSDGRVAHVRGTIENRFAQRVEGIRYAVQISVPGEQARVLDTWRRQVSTALDPGEHKRLSLDVSSMYASGGRWQFRIIATPVKLGGKDISPPADWP
jgi:hypothetical protein